METYFKYRGNDTQYFREFICCYYNIDNRNWSLTVKGETIRGKGVSPLLSEINNVIERFKTKYKPKVTTKLVCYINNLNLCKHFLTNFDGKIIENSFYDSIDGHRIEFEFETMHVLWRNFTPIVNTKDMCELRKLFPERKYNSECMKDFILSFDEKIPAKQVRYSLAHMAKRRTTKPIMEVCKKDMAKNGTSFCTMEMYNNMTAGSKVGLIITEDNYCWKELTGVVSFDLKSAYPSVIVNDSKFPIGQIKNYGTAGRPDWACAEMRRKLEKGEWVKVVIESNDNLDFVKQFKSKVGPTYGMEYYDLLSLRMFSPEIWIELLKYLETHRNWKMYTSYKTDYLLEDYRKRNVELYLEKEAISDKNNMKRIQNKTCLDMGYGKSIQKHDFTELEQVNKYYFNRGDNYLMPQHGMHCVAATKYRLLRLLLGVTDELIACDTDGVRFARLTQKVQDAINRENNLILQMNEKAGFAGLNIGTWEQEYIADRFIQFNTKTYWYEVNGKLTCKMAGITKDEIQSYISQHSDPFTDILQNGHTFNQQQEYMYDKEKQIFKRTFTQYDLRNPN